MKKILLTVLFFIVVFSAFPQQGTYVRKSISSLDAVWFQPGSLGLSFDMQRFMDFIAFYIETPRFDYNELPLEYTQRFIQRANQLPEITPGGLARVLEETVVVEILGILNDPEVQQARGAELQTEAGARSFAASKAQSFGLTVDELEVLFNSAYMYLPFITSFDLATDRNGNQMVTINGGMIWWRLVVNPNGSTEVREILSTTTLGLGFVDYDRSVNVFTFGNDEWIADPVEYAQYEAMLAFSKNLGVKTKEIDDFKLSAQITEVTGGLFNRRYGFPLGTREGVHLDDGFYIVEFEENPAGEIVSVQRGFVRVSQTGKNAEDPTELTYAAQLFGRRVSEGAIVMEHPRLGIDLSLGGGAIIGTNITRDHTYYYTNDDASSLITIDSLFSYNIAPITGTSQSFLNLEVSVGIPNVSQDTDVSILTISPYLSYSRYFGGRLFAGFNVGGGADGLSFQYTSFLFDDISLTLWAPGIKAGLEVGYMLTPDLKILGSAGYKLGFRPVWNTLEINESLVAEGFNLDPRFNDLRLGGARAAIMFSYALGELPIDVFGFLDPLKRY